MTLLASNASPPGSAKSTFARMALSRQREALLVEPRRQNELLASLSAAALQGGAFEAAFMFADRRCRRPTPSAHDFLLRSSASRRLGYDESATKDLAQAFEIDPIDELVIFNVLRWGAQEYRRIAAANFIAGASEDHETVAFALRAFKSSGVPIALRLRVSRGMYRGWVAWAQPRALELRIGRGGAESSFALNADPAHRLSEEGWAAAEIAIELESARRTRVSFWLDGKLVMTSSPTAVTQDARVRTVGAQSVASSRERPNWVDIIVPVYENYGATKACLDSLELGRIKDSQTGDRR